MLNIIKNQFRFKGVDLRFADLAVGKTKHILIGSKQANRSHPLLCLLRNTDKVIDRIKKQNRCGLDEICHVTITSVTPRHFCESGGVSTHIVSYTLAKPR